MVNTAQYNFFRKEERLMKMIAFKVEDELHKQVRHKVADLNTNIKDYVTYLIKKDLEKEKE